jgi:hypothetical protein
MQVCLYFINSVVDSYSSYQFMQQPEILERAKRWPQHYPTIGCGGWQPVRLENGCTQRNKTAHNRNHTAQHKKTSRLSINSSQRTSSFAFCSVPYFSLGVLLPCAVLAALGIKVLMTASVLVTWEVVDSLKLVWSQLLILVLNGVKPNELVVKRLAMMGCTGGCLAGSERTRFALGLAAEWGRVSGCVGVTLPCPLPLSQPLSRCWQAAATRRVPAVACACPRGLAALVLAHSMQEHRVQISSYAGLLLSGAGDERRQPSRRKSLVLLAGRLLMALLFLYVGISQARGSQMAACGSVRRGPGRRVVQLLWVA